ncbi:hypothetical protein HOY82DRAFT_651090 [Tuber indicum]|nr:hypothetical protein HOY82DRAFT_651090 [Tuber indicum]
MAQYPPLAVGLLLLLSTLTRLSVSQSAWKLDPQTHLALMYNHMSAVVNSTIYTIGGTALYWTPKSTASSIVSQNNDSVYILRTGNSFLRALDLSKPVDFEAEFSDTMEVISELPFAIPLVKRGAVWADQDKIYYWGGELETESIYLDGVFQNKTREWPDPMKYYTYDLSQRRGSGTWQTISISGAGGSDTLTDSPSYGESIYSAEARKGFYLGGVMSRSDLKNKDGSDATRGGAVYYSVSSMVVFDAVTNVWKNESIIEDLNGLREGAMVYVAGVGEKGILVRMGGARKNEFVGVPWTLRRIFIPEGAYIWRSARNTGASLIYFFFQISFDTVYVYDIAGGVWYRQPTTSKTKIFPEPRQAGFCASAIAAPDNTSFTIYIYGGFDQNNHKKSTWALTMPYFQWLPVGSTGGPERGRSGVTCHTVGGQLVMVRGAGDQMNRGDTNGGTYFYDMTNLTWSLKYRPSRYRVPKTIYDVIGGNEHGGAHLRGPADDKGFTRGLGLLFAAAGKHTTPDPGCGSHSPAGAIVGGVIGGVALLSAIGAGIWALFWLHRRRPDTTGETQAAGGPKIRTGGNPPGPNHQSNSPWRYEIGRVPAPQPAHELHDVGF